MCHLQQFLENFDQQTHQINIEKAHMSVSFLGWMASAYFLFEDHLTNSTSRH